MLEGEWGGMWDLNPRLPEPQSGALPTELIPPQGNSIWYQERHQRSKSGIMGLGYPNQPEKEQSVKSLILCAAVCATAFAAPQETGLTASGRAAIEKAVLEVNAQMTRAARSEEYASALQSL